MENQQEKKKQKSSLKDYAKYSSIAFKMMAIILAGIFGGRKLDQILKFKFPVFTLGLTLTALAAAFYSLFKDINKS